MLLMRKSKQQLTIWLAKLSKGTSDQVGSEALDSLETTVFQYLTGDTKVSLPIF